MGDARGPHVAHVEREAETGAVATMPLNLSSGEALHEGWELPRRNPM